LANHFLSEILKRLGIAIDLKDNEVWKLLEVEFYSFEMLQIPLVVIKQ